MQCGLRASRVTRAEALSRAQDLPRYLETEIANLSEGVRLGYTAPKTNVEAVIAQMDNLLEAEPEETPWADPALRDDSADFSRSLLELIADRINPAIRL